VRLRIHLRLPRYTADRGVHDLNADGSTRLSPVTHNDDGTTDDG
jgi:hypothetical protein